MHYFFDFDRTVFDTESFKRAVKKRSSLHELMRQLYAIYQELFSDDRTLSKRRIASRTFGTYASHGHFSFHEHELKDYLYPDAVEFFRTHGKDCTVVTYGVRAFITAKVTNALTHAQLNDIVYTHQKKGRTIRRLSKEHAGPLVFVDDAHFQLESVHRACPEIAIYEMRRDGGAGDGRWPVIRSLDELP